MASSIFKETTLTPFIFEKKYLCEDMRNFEKLLNALEDLAESGFVVGVYNSWLEIVSQAIMAYGDEIQYEMEVAMKHLADRQRIVCLNDKICSPENEVIWIEKANSLNNIREFDIILATFEALNTKTLDTTHRNQFREAFQNRGAQVLPQTKENMKKLIAPILSYAEIIKIYDPYFDITKSRYTDALELICEELGAGNALIHEPIVEIHTSIKIILDKNKMIDWKLLSGCQEKIIFYEKKYNKNIKIYIWEDKNENSWHDRWIVTNQCAITLGKGTDISQWTDSTWSIVNYNQISNIEKKFISNRGEYNLIVSIDKKETLKPNKPLQYREYKNEDEISKQPKKYYCQKTKQWIKS